MARLSVLVAQIGKYGEQGLLKDVDIIGLAAAVLEFLDLVGEHLRKKVMDRWYRKPSLTCGVNPWCRVAVLAPISLLILDIGGKKRTPRSAPVSS